MFWNRRPQPRFFLARKAGIAYLQVPKVACTSFKVALALLNRPELRDEIAVRPTLIHARSEWNDMVAANDRVLPDLFRFTFVREPIARFISFYKNKVFQPPRGVLPEIAEQGFGLGMSISAVLDVIDRTPEHKIDPHIIPQTWLVFDGRKPRVQFIGRIERLAEDLQEFATQSGVVLDIGHHNRSNPETASEIEISPTERERIIRFYKDDFARFGYPFPK